ncbi:AH receptor-interacting protein [Holothuria leucospilota]|uniref:AH receptor-interacting protein n=1 Tax=Holothuria leucospilota TaxID=206669 RepID=A0A9Q1CGE0_HOLLE|nr:AH receptor-interacting protein [Holothuria leucospilota]
MEVGMGMNLRNGITKKVIYPGKGDLPEYHSETKITFHYRCAKLNEGNTVLDDSRVGTGQPMELVTGKQFKLDVWEECLKTMRVQEVADFFVDRSHLTVFPAVMKTLRDVRKGGQAHNHKDSHCCGLAKMNKEGLGYDDLDALVKSAEHLVFRFEVLKVENPGSYKQETWAMSDEERKKILPTLKEEGNNYYKNKDYQKAADKYAEALGCLENLLLHEKPNSEDWLILDSVRIPFLLNFAQCKYQLGEYYQAIEHATSVLDKEEDNVKALFRRGQAHRHCCNYQEARNDLLKAAKLDPKLGAVVRKELQAIEEMEKERDAEEKEKLAGLFDKIREH